MKPSDHTDHPDHLDLGEKLGFELGFKLGFELDHKTGRYIIRSEEERKRLLIFLLNNPRKLSPESIAYYIDASDKSVRSVCAKANEMEGDEHRTRYLCAFFEKGEKGNAIAQIWFEGYVKGRFEVLEEIFSHKNDPKSPKTDASLMDISVRGLAKLHDIPVKFVQMIADGVKIKKVVAEYLKLDPREWIRLLR